ncbi:MAG: FtsB family cell division protein [Candidatus Nanopelagicales bacterium]
MSGRRPTLTGRAAILVLVLAALVVTLAIPLRAWMSQQAEIAALEADVAQSRERVESLRAELKDWEDPAFVIAQARSRLHFVFPGEVGYVVLGEDDRPIVPEQERAADEAPWYSRLWDSTLQADRS